MDKKIPEVFYDAAAGGYWLRLTPRRFLELGRADVKLHLQVHGLSSGKEEDGVSETSRALYVAQVDRSCDYAGPLAGHRTGLWETTAGQRVLVTSECAEYVWAKPAKSKEDFPFIERYLDALYGAEQAQHACFWLSIAVRSLRAGDFAPGQMLINAGPSQCGKSFFHHLVTELLGGRMAKPFAWMSGKTNFNADIAQAESLVIEDELGGHDIRTRRQFGATIKQLTVNEQFHLHGKGKTAIVLPTYKRLTMSVNEEAENMMVLPPLDESILDKLMLFKCRDARPALFDDRAKNRETVRKELPAFRAWLDALRVPAKLKDQRFGIRAYHAPELVTQINTLAPENRLLALIDQVVFEKDDSGPGVKLTADELEKRLRSSAFNFAVDKLLNYPTACGVYLSRLGNRYPDRITSTTSKGRVRWSITPPE